METEVLHQRGGFGGMVLADHAVRRPDSVRAELHGQQSVAHPIARPAAARVCCRHVEFWQLDSEKVEAHAPRVLRSDADANRIILLLLPQGESLADHQVHEHALVVVLDGEVVFRAGAAEQHLGPHGLVHFKPAERHEVQAVSDARLLICLAPWPGIGHPSRHD